MKSEDEPVTNDEWLIRLVWGDRVTNRTPIISPSSFEPRKDEVAGISFYRYSCLAHPADALIPIQESKRDHYALVRVGVALLRQLQCTVSVAPRLDVPGHVLVPEINSLAFGAEKQRLKTLFLHLANEASANIIRRPHD